MKTFEELSKAVGDLDGQIVSVSRDDKAYRVIFECRDWYYFYRRRRFELVFEDVPEATATPSACSSFQITDDHPLLWDYNDEQVTMFFSSAPLEPLALLGRLYKAHADLLDGWRELSEYWHADTELLRAGYGRLASGPRRVIDQYAPVVAEAMRYSIVHESSPRGGYRVVLFENCYVVCRSVSVIEHEWAASSGAPVSGGIPPSPRPRLAADELRFVEHSDMQSETEAMRTETFEIASTDYWIQVLEMLVQNWALIAPNEKGGVTAHFFGDTSGVFDRLSFPTQAGAEAALRHNGFLRFADETELRSFLRPPPPPFREQPHPSGPIFSSGRFWR
jgi:hypothetical protein